MNAGVIFFRVRGTLVLFRGKLEHGKPMQFMQEGVIRPLRSGCSLYQRMSHSFSVIWCWGCVGDGSAS